jgi:hypothetical protein
VLGGYTIHHALAYSKQITRWFGQAFARSVNGELGTLFVSDFLDAINQFGVTAPGASGATLVSQNDRVVGVLSLARNTGGPAGFDSCPSPTPVAPDADNRVVTFNSLAAVWDSTSDTTSSTGTRTLRSVLDPGSTGANSVGSIAAAQLLFDASTLAPALNDMVTLTWSAPNATQCTASGGAAGDNWPGVLPGNGSRQVTLASAADITYRLRCDLASGGGVSSSVLVHWKAPAGPPVTAPPAAGSAGGSSSGGGGTLGSRELLLLTILCFLACHARTHTGNREAPRLGNRFPAFRTVLKARASR